MLNRRQLLLSAGALGLPAAAAWPMPIDWPTVQRIGLLQVRQPFVDEHDPEGSRERAFSAFHALLEASLATHGPLDWLAAGALPLTGHVSPDLRERVALQAHSFEISRLREFARERNLRLTLGAWWRGASTSTALLVFESDGTWRIDRLDRPELARGVAVRMPQTKEHDRAGLAASCRENACYGAYIGAINGPQTPPGARPETMLPTAFFAPDGTVLAEADAVSETCLVAAI